MLFYLDIKPLLYIEMYIIHLRKVLYFLVPDRSIEIPTVYYVIMQTSHYGLRSGI